MSGESIFRRNPLAGSPFEQTVKSRSKLLKSKQTISGKSIQIENPAWVSIRGTCMACSSAGSTMVLPEDLKTWDSTYNHPTIKPRPILESVDIQYTGDHGLALRLNANIICYDIDTFELVRKHFLLPGNVVDVRFGYSQDQWNSDSDAFNEIRNFKVAVFSFSAGDGGTWTCSFSAVTSALAIENIDMAQALKGDNLIYSYSGVIGSEYTKNVTSIAELIVCDYQRNGGESIDRVDSSNSGYVIGSFAGYTPQNPADMKARIVIYTSDHLRNWLGQTASHLWRWAARKVNLWDETEDAIHQIYVTLGYIADRIVNNQLKPVVNELAKGDPDIAHLKDVIITFHPVYSKSRIPPDVESGDPLSVLILGDGRGEFSSNDGSPFSFATLRGFEGATADDVIAAKNNIVSLDKILIHRDVVLTAFNNATSKDVDNSERVDPKDTKDTVVNISDFFTELFKAIKDATGGALNLRLVYNPDDPDHCSLIIVDQNWGGFAPIKCFVFNPIDGDGNTISCNVSSNGGSDEYRTSMFLANSKKGDVAALLRDCEQKVESARSERKSDYKSKIKELKKSPGHLLNSRFDSNHVASFKSLMADAYRNAVKNDNAYENINWPGMTIDLTIHGSYGIMPGCAVSTTQLSDDWRMKNIYFMVTEVVHSFRESRWTTNIRGIMSFYDKLQYVKL